MDAEKQAWLDSIGLQELPTPVMIKDKEFSYIAHINGQEMYYSMQYLSDTPLEELKKMHEKNLAKM